MPLYDEEHIERLEKLRKAKKLSKGNEEQEFSKWGASIAVVLLFLIVVIALCALPVVFLGESSCVQSGDELGLPSEYRMGRFDGGCYLNVNGVWLPEWQVRGLQNPEGR